MHKHRVIKNRLQREPRDVFAGKEVASRAGDLCMTLKNHV